MIKWLLAVSTAYCEATGLSEARVSTLVLNGGHRLKDIREGNGSIGVSTLDRSLQWFSDRWPENAVWPSDVARPAPAPIPSAEF